MLLRMALPHKGQVCAWSECPHCKEDTSEVTFTSGSNIYIHADGWWRGGEFTTDGLFVCVCWVLWFACRLLPFGRWKLIVLNVVAQSQSQTAAWKQAKLFCTHIVGDIRATALAEYRVYKVRGIVVIFNTIARPLSHHPSHRLGWEKKQKYGIALLGWNISRLQNLKCRQMGGTWAFLMAGIVLDASRNNS